MPTNGTINLTFDRSDQRGKLAADSRKLRENATDLKWEGVLIDPIGALLGVLAFTLCREREFRRDPAFHPGEMALSIGTGLVVGAVGAAVLWLLLRGLQRAAPGQGSRRR